MKLTARLFKGAKQLVFALGWVLFLMWFFAGSTITWQFQPEKAKESVMDKVKSGIGWVKLAKNLF